MSPLVIKHFPIDAKFIVFELIYIYIYIYLKCTCLK